MDGRVTGRITDSAGRGAPATLYFEAIDRQDRKLTGVAPDDGEFEIDSVPPGKYILYFNVISIGPNGAEQQERYYYPASFDREKALPIEVGLGEKVSGYNFTLPPVLKVQVIEGIVKNSDGSPAAKTVVLVSIQDKKTPGIYRTSNWPGEMITDEQGRFEIHGFKGNTYEVWAREEITEGRRPLLSSERVSLKLEKDLSDIKLTLTQSGEAKDKQRVESQKRTT